MIICTCARENVKSTTKSVSTSSGFSARSQWSGRPRWLSVTGGHTRSQQQHQQQQQSSGQSRKACSKHYLIHSVLPRSTLTAVVALPSIPPSVRTAVKSSSLCHIHLVLNKVCSTKKTVGDYLLRDRKKKCASVMVILFVCVFRVGRVWWNHILLL